MQLPRTPYNGKALQLRLNKRLRLTSPMSSSPLRRMSDCTSLSTVAPPSLSTPPAQRGMPAGLHTQQSGAASGKQPPTRLTAGSMHP